MFNVIDLFCGIGGFSYGFQMTKRFKVALGVDMWAVALETFRYNHPDTSVISENIMSIKDDFWSKFKGDTSVIIAGPPCQGFSMSGKRDILDERNNLFKEVVRVTSIVNPDVVVIENVVGLLSMKNEHGEMIKDLIVSDFNNIGYFVKHKVLNAADFGVPQQRKRVIFVATKYDDFVFPDATFGNKSKPYISVGEALGNITDGLEYLEPNCDYQKLMSGSKSIFNHDRIQHAQNIIERMKHVPQGGNWKDIPDELGKGGGVHSNNYRRLNAESPSITIKHASKSMIIHPWYDRTPTVREIARIQSFNDDFIIKGTRYDQHQQLANAVPPLLGRAIALEVIQYLESHHEQIR